MSSLFSVAIDGPAGAGKSSLAKKAASKYKFVYVDTGAIYRTVALAAYRSGIDSPEKVTADAVAALFPELDIDIRYDGTGLQCMYLRGENVSGAIRQPEISMMASSVSAIPEVRSFLMEMQRDFARKYSVVMDGRDIGSVVLPDADLKIYLTASSAARARRRMKELEENGIPCDYETVLRDIEQRDYQDMHRDTAPLVVADGAIEVDTSELNFEESFNKLCEIIDERIAELTSVTALL